MIAGRREGAEADRLIRGFLDDQSHCTSFQEEWVSFDLCEKEARENVTDLLADYSELMRCGSLVDLRSFEQELLDSRTLTDLSFPLGQAFLWRFKPRVSGTLLRRIVGSSAPAVEIMMALPGVRRLVGTLSSFVVETAWNRIICGRDVRVATPMVDANV